MPSSNPALDILARQAAGKPSALLALARVLLAQGQREQAHTLCEQAVHAGPADPEVTTLAAEIFSHNVPQWHFGIVRDEIRNAAYEAALQRAIRPGMRVLEIGTGSGLLAMMAARAGAAEVLTCEMNPAVAAAARTIIAANGYADRVRVIGKLSSDLDPQADLGGPVDLLVSEIVSNDMVGEGALPAHEQAVRRLLKPGAVIIPARGAVRVALAFDAELENKRMRRVAGFDLSAFNRLAEPRYRLAIGEPRLSLLSDTADLFHFDFQSGGPFPESRASVTVQASGGKVNGIAQWIRLDMDDHGQYENQPVAGGTSCWATWFHPLPQALELVAGQPVTLSGSHDRQTLRLWATAPTV